MRLYSLQALRFWAALAVAHFHAVNMVFGTTGRLGVLGPASALFGRAGVDVFFVLSGLVITLSAQRLSAGQFIAARLARIWPIYLIVSAPFMAAAIAAGRFGWRDALASVFLWPATDVITAPKLAVGWSLCFEALFYAAMTLVLWRRRMAWVLLAVYGLALATRTGAVLQFVGNPLTLEFLIGVGLAFAPRARWHVAAIPLGLAILIAGAIAPWPPYGVDADFLRGEGGMLRVLTLGLPSALIVWGASSWNARPNVVTYLGDASYVLYLVHLPVLALTVVPLARFTALGPDAIAAAAVAASVLAAWRAHELVEKPLLAWLRRRPARLTPAKA